MKVIIKGEDSKYVHDFVVYDNVVLSQDDPVIKEHVKKALDSARIIPERVQVKTTMEYVV